MAITKNLITGKGETFTLDMQYLDEDNNPVDLTGHAVFFEITNRGTEEGLSSVNGAVDEEGNISIKVYADETVLWTAGVYGYKVVHTNPDLDVKWLLTGRFTVTEGEGA